MIKVAIIEYGPLKKTTQKKKSAIENMWVLTLSALVMPKGKDFEAKNYEIYEKGIAFCESADFSEKEISIIAENFLKTSRFFCEILNKEQVIEKIKSVLGGRITVNI